MLAVAAMAGAAFGQATCGGLRDGPKGTVTEIVDGDTLMLDNGIIVRLVGTQAPKLPLGREGFETWPKAEEAKSELARLAMGKAVQLRYGGAEIDRYDRALAQVFVLGEPEIWVQGAMVSAGFARVYSFPDNRRCLAELYAAERQARANRLGIWSDPYYSLRQADRPAQIAAREGHYELVEGRVLQADEAGGRIYLNFGRSWKQDFTVVIESRARKLFSEAGLDPLALTDTLIRVRGWVDVEDGPRIEVTHPEQIEVLARP